MDTIKAEKNLENVAVDQYARFVIYQNEGPVALQSKKYSVFEVYELFGEAMNDIILKDDIFEYRFEIILTDNRIYLWSPISSKVFGKPDIYPGKATGRVVELAKITQIGLEGGVTQLDRKITVADKINSTDHMLHIWGNSDMLQEFIMTLFQKMGIWEEQFVNFDYNVKHEIEMKFDVDLGFD
ncbi:MAG: hypothetical protein LBU20_02405 [Candidatus Nomurabacteria bacterium]|nr:hypothetical protein [Candidatus Nomurabacteria bacterium]